MLVIFGRSLSTVFSYYGSAIIIFYYQKIFGEYGLSFSVVATRIDFFPTVFSYYGSRTKYFIYLKIFLVKYGDGKGCYPTFIVLWSGTITRPIF